MKTLLSIENMRVHFPVPGLRVPLRAVDGVSFSLNEGECVGLVGESGCGKSTLGNALIRLVPVTSGAIRYGQEDVLGLRGAALQRYRRSVQMVFQDPLGSMNPRIPVGRALEEVLEVHRVAQSEGIRSGKAALQFRRGRVQQLFERVGLDPAYMDRYPHEFSGGQRQRIGIARALVLNPRLVIADEPVSALDVSVQVQVLNLIKHLQKEIGFTCLFVAHDLAVVRYMCERVMVMYLGRIVESGSNDDLFTRPAHPYTEALLSAVPDVDKGLKWRGRAGQRIVLRGDVPSAAQAISGCVFHPRCHRAQAICREQAPPCETLDGGHVSVCHFARSWGAEGLLRDGAPAAVSP